MAVTKFIYLNHLTSQISVDQITGRPLYMLILGFAGHGSF